MKTYFTADTHFSHKRIVELCDRPFSSVEEMNAALLEGINSTVSSRDRLVILGDICMGKLDESLPLLAEIQAAELVLVPGNHDRWSPAYEHRGDANAKREAFRLRYRAQHPQTVAMPGVDESWLKDGDRTFEAVRHWDFCCLSDEWEGHPLDDVIFSHFPYEGDSHDEDRYKELRPVDYGAPLVHGHVHGEWHVKGRQYNVGVDVNDFKPVSEETLSDWVRSL